MNISELCPDWKEQRPHPKNDQSLGIDGCYFNWFHIPSLFLKRVNIFNTAE